MSRQAIYLKNHFRLNLHFSEVIDITFIDTIFVIIKEDASINFKYKTFPFY